MVASATDVKIELFANDGSTTTLKEKVSLLDKEIIDATVMSKKALLAFLKEIQMQKSRESCFLYT